jgi:two-component system, cell cycle response regulator
MKLLIATDDPTTRATLTETAEQLGFDPICAEDGEMAWDIIQTVAPKMMLLNDDISQLNGVDLCARIHEQCAPEKKPYTILLTDSDRVDDLKQGLEAGVNEYLCKPYHIVELQARLKVGKQLISLQSELNAARKRLDMVAPSDELTGLYSHRAFNERLQREWSRAMRSSDKLSIAFIDIDHFKELNESYGTITGDKCLRAIAREIAETVKRSTDFVARHDGETFVLILPLTTDLEVVLERCRLAVEQLQIDHKDSDLGIVTISIGGASVTPNGTHKDLDTFLNQADKQLYKAKQEGRNQISVIDLDS